jgi:hypothetical protein
MKQTLLCLAAFATAVAAMGNVANGQLTIVFDENTYPTNPENSFGAFTFNDFSVLGAFTDGPSSVILDVVDSNGVDGVYGGVGVDYGTPPGTNNHDFDVSSAQWEVRLKILPNNRASAFRTSYIDHDPQSPMPAAEEYVYEFGLTNVPNDSAFHILTKTVSTELFHQNVVGFDVADDGINNPGLRRIQIQSVIGSAERLNIEIDYVRIVAIPEPTSLTLLALNGPAILLSNCRRRTAIRNK